MGHKAGNQTILPPQRLRFLKFTFPHNTNIVENNMIRNFCWGLLSTLGSMKFMLFIFGAGVQ